MTNQLDKSATENNVRAGSARFLRLLGLSMLWALLFGSLGICAALILKKIPGWPYLPEFVFMIFVSLGVAKIGRLIRRPSL